MHDSDVLELAGLFLTLGEREPFEPEAEADRVPTDVELRLHLATGYTLDQLGAALDALDTLFAAGFIAAEARATGQTLESVYGLLTQESPALGLAWTVTSLEVGSISFRGIFERSGKWASEHKSATIWVISGATVLAPVIGIHVAAIGIGGWAAGGAVQLLGHTHDSRLKKRKLADSQQSGKPKPDIQAQAVSRQEQRSAGARPRPVTPFVDVGLSGPADAKEAFVAAVKRIEGVENQSRMITRGNETGRWMRIWAVIAPARERLEDLASETGVTIDGFEEGPPAHE